MSIQQVAATAGTSASAMPLMASSVRSAPDRLPIAASSAMRARCSRERSIARAAKVARIDPAVTIVIRSRWSVEPA